MNPRPSVLETDALPTELYPSEAVAGLAAKGAACKTVVRGDCADLKQARCRAL